MPVPDLSAIRKNWAKTLQGLPSLPRETTPGNREPSPVSPSAASTNPAGHQQSSIPKLPSMGAVASKAVLAMEGHDDLFGENTPDSSPPTDPLPSFPAFPNQPGTSSLESTVKTIHQPAKETLSAMPTMDEPKVSIPLVREQIAEPQAMTTPSATTDETVKPPQRQEPSPTPVNPPTTKVTKISENPVTPFGELPVNEKADPQISPPQPPLEKEPVFRRATSTPPTSPPAREYTDQDLQEALQPFIFPAVDKFLYTPTHGIHTYLEPMLRSTVRRAIAEQMEEASPFREVSGWDKFAWKMRALIGSRTYEDIVFSHTKRYQVEEVFLLRPKSRSLISYASHDPSRHAKPSKVQNTIKKIAAKTADKDQKDACFITWDNSRNLMIRKGEHCLLAAIVRGPSNAILRADLDYALRQAEERFGKTLEEESDIHVQILQPLLESCLLIQAPAIPN